MGKKVYLIDTENVGSVWVDVLPSLNKHDSLYLFYTVHSSGIAYSDLVKIMDQTQKFEMVECFTGRNGLDFQLVSYLGYMMRSSSKSEYIIVSNDNGYDAVVKFWNAKGGNVSRIKGPALRQQIAANDSLEQNENTSETVESEESDITNEEQQKTVGQPKAEEQPKPKSPQLDFNIWLPEGEEIPIETLLTIFHTAGKKEMQKIYVQMVKNFGQAKGGIIYHALKPHLEEIYENLD